MAHFFWTSHGPQPCRRCWIGGPIWVRALLQRCAWNVGRSIAEGEPRKVHRGDGGWESIRKWWCLCSKVWIEAETGAQQLMSWVLKLENHPIHYHHGCSHDKTPTCLYLEKNKTNFSHMQRWLGNLLFLGGKHLMRINSSFTVWEMHFQVRLLFTNQSICSIWMDINPSYDGLIYQTIMGLG